MPARLGLLEDLFASLGAVDDNLLDHVALKGTLAKWLTAGYAVEDGIYRVCDVVGGKGYTFSLSFIQSGSAFVAGFTKEQAHDFLKATNIGYPGSHKLAILKAHVDFLALVYVTPQALITTVSLPKVVLGPAVCELIVSNLIDNATNRLEPAYLTEPLLVFFALVQKLMPAAFEQMCSHPDIIVELSKEVDEVRNPIGLTGQTRRPYCHEAWLLLHISALYMFKNKPYNPKVVMQSRYDTLATTLGLDTALPGVAEDLDFIASA